MRTLFLIFFCFVCLEAVAEVRVYADEDIQENTSLLVKGTGLKDLKACLWLYNEDKESSACNDLFVRLNNQQTRAKIYLPSVDGDTEAKLVIRSGPYTVDEQEFLITIKDVINPRKESLARFQFFTKKKDQKGYSLVAKREDPIPLILNGSFTKDGNVDERPSVYTAQALTFEDKHSRKFEKKHHKRKKYGKKYDDLVRLKPRQKPPLGAQLGDVFVSSSNALCVFMDDTWMKIVGSGQCIPDSIKAPVLPKPIALPKQDF